LAAVLGVIRTLRLVGQRPEWRREQFALIGPNDERRLFKSAMLAIAWGKDALAPRALAEAGGEWFDELSMVTGLLAWLAWEVGIDAEESLQRMGPQGLEDERWDSIQLLAMLGPWLTGDSTAITTLEESVSRTPRRRVDADRWLRSHSALLEGFALIASAPDHQEHLGRLPRPGDLVLLSNQESPRVRVILNVLADRNDWKVVIFDPNSKNSKRRTFLASRVVTLPWTPGPASLAVSA